jgi:TatA/E family protein of Tat protein translocase
MKAHLADTVNTRQIYVSGLLPFFGNSYDEHMSFSETIFLFILALVIFGPKKLPEIARMIGKTLNEFRRASNEFKVQIEQEIAHLEVEEKKKIAPPVAAPEGTASRTLSAASSEEPSSVLTPADTNSGVPAPTDQFASQAGSTAEKCPSVNSAEPTTEVLPAEAVASSTSSSSPSSPQESHA